MCQSEALLALCAFTVDERWQWGAFVLLDEGDALVEKREKGQLLLNSLVGVLLRTLDSFEGACERGAAAGLTPSPAGILFITSNRLMTIDPACLSRVTLAIRYGTKRQTSKTKKLCVDQIFLLRRGAVGVWTRGSVAKRAEALWHPQRRPV